MKFFKKFLIVVITILIFIGIIESFLRYKHRNDDIYRYRLINIDGLKKYHPYYRSDGSVDTGLLYFGQQLNSQGFKSPAVANEKDSATFRFITFGGSTTFGFKLPDWKKTWPYLVNINLNKYHKTDYINAALGGYSSINSLLKLQLRMVYYNPDLVIFYHGANDIVLLSNPYFKYDYSHIRKAFLPARFALNRLDKLYTYFVIHKLWFRFKYNKYYDSIIEKTKPVSSAKLDKLSSSKLKIFKNNVENFIVTAKSKNIKVALITFATYIDNNKKAADPLLIWRRRIHNNFSFDGTIKAYKQLNNIIRKLADKHNVILIDMANLLAKNKNYFCDTIHFTTAGAEKFAGIVSSELLKYNIFSDR